MQCTPWKVGQNPYQQYKAQEAHAGSVWSSTTDLPRAAGREPAIRGSVYVPLPDTLLI